VQAELSQPLVVGNTYYAECYVSLGDFTDYGSNNIGMYFSTTNVYQGTCYMLNFTPQILETNIITDTANWVKVSGTFTATTAAGFLIIGNFFDNASTQYFVNGGSSVNARYFIDDVSVTEVVGVPSAAFNAPNTICPGTCTNFTNLSTNATSYQWSFAGATPASSTDFNPVNICYNTPGQYDVTLISSGANGSDTLTVSNFITVYPYPPPQGITQSGDTLFANQGASSYQWYYDGSIIPGATNYYYPATASGNYNVVASDQNNCEVEAVIFDVMVGIDKAVINSDLAIFPNPVSESLNITGLKSDAAISEISIINSLGELVMAIPLKTVNCSGKPTSTCKVDVSDLAKGYYLICIKKDNRVSRLPFMKR
jgi:PKD repeat protein